MERIILIDWSVTIQSNGCGGVFLQIVFIDLPLFHNYNLLNQRSVSYAPSSVIITVIYLIKKKVGCEIPVPVLQSWGWFLRMTNKCLISPKFGHNDCNLLDQKQSWLQNSCTSFTELRMISMGWLKNIIPRPPSLCCLTVQANTSHSVSLKKWEWKVF